MTIRLSFNYQPLYRIEFRKKKSTTSFGEYLRENRRLVQNRGLTEVKLIESLLPLFKNLSADERAIYENRARESRDAIREQTRQERINRVSENCDPLQVLQEKFRIDIERISSIFKTTEDVISKKFYLIDFQILCHLEEVHECHQTGHIPLEIGLIEISLKEGIINQYHQFIKVEDIPYGISSFGIIFLLLLVNFNYF